MSEETFPCSLTVHVHQQSAQCPTGSFNFSCAPRKARWWWEEEWHGRQDKTSLGFGPQAIHFPLPPFHLPLFFLFFFFFFFFFLLFQPPPPNQAPILLLHCAVIKHMMEEEGGSSECSSGCQSGWTAYLDHSSSASLPHPLLLHKGGSFHEEEDLSMVSDASSGPPHLHEEDDEQSSSYLGFTKRSAKKRRLEAEKQHEQCSLLDDTASSPFFSFPKASFNGDDSSNKCMSPPTMEGVLEFSCGFSATDEQENCAMEKQIRLLHSSAPAKQTPARPVKRFHDP